MRHLALSLWVGREWCRSATAWSLGLAAVSLGPLCLLAAPWGIVGADTLNDVYFSSYWYLSSYIGVVVGLALFARAGVVLSELGSGLQLVVAVAALGLLSLSHGLAALAALRILGVVGRPAWWPGLLCVAHWSALGAFVQRTPTKLGTKWLVLSGLGWWIPALLAGVPGAPGEMRGMQAQGNVHVLRP